MIKRERLRPLPDEFQINVLGGASEGESIVLHYGDTLQIDFSIYNPYEQSFDFQKGEMHLRIVPQYLSTNDFGFCYYDNRIVIPPHATYNGYLLTIVSDNIKPGKNDLTLGLGDGISSFITEGSRVKVEIVE